MKKVIIILGPTCVGKTGLSILLAKSLHTDIISADSMLVYRHMDIGTAKPSQNELRTVTHHLINILNPNQMFSAGLFKEKATAIIDVLHKENKIPIIAGGTGLYIRTLTKGLFEGPGADEQFREELKQKEKRNGGGYLHNMLKSVDPDAADKLEPNDLRRVIRALEIVLREKKGMSEIQRQSTRPAGYDFIKIGLTRERKELYRRIEERVDMMLSRGLIEETEELLKLNPGRTALQALGYKEMAMYLNGECDLSEATMLIKKRTKMYAKRQYTWFRKESGIHWVDISGMADIDNIFAKMVNDVEIMSDLLYPFKIKG